MITLLPSACYSDERGSLTKLLPKGFDTSHFPIQDAYIAESFGNIFRGLHRQMSPYGQTKIFSVIDGSIILFALRTDHDPTLYIQTVESLSQEQKSFNYLISSDSFSGYYVTSDSAKVAVLSSGHYLSQHEQLINPNSIISLVPELRDQLIILSDKDSTSPLYPTSNIKVVNL